MIHRSILFAPGFCCRVAVVVLLGCGLLPAGVQAQGDPLRLNSPKVLAAFHDVVVQPSQSTVRVRCDGKDVALGTIVGADGWIVSKYSEIKGPVTCQLKDGRELSAKIVGVQEPYDLVMLKVEAKDLKPVQWGEVKSATVGNFVVTPGTANDPIAVGVVSVAARKVTTRDQPPISADSGWLGISLEPGDLGVKIADIMPNSAAAKAGFKVNDAILAVAGMMVSDPDTLISTIQRHKVGDVVTVKVKRGEEEVEIKATLGKRPTDDRASFQNRLGNEISNRRGGFPSILQHDTVLKPKECGGPLVDLDGKTVGVNIARAGRTETFAVPADAVVALLPELKSGKLLPAEVRDTIAHTEAAKEKLTALKTAVEKAEAEFKAAEKRLKETRAALEKAEAETKANK
jgi:serine protease Do